MSHFNFLIAKILHYVVLPVVVVWFFAFAVFNSDVISLDLWPLPLQITSPLSVFTVLILALGYFIGRANAYARSVFCRKSSHAKSLSCHEKDTIPLETGP